MRLRFLELVPCFFTACSHQTGIRKVMGMYLLLYTFNKCFVNPSLTDCPKNMQRFFKFLSEEFKTFLSITLLHIQYLVNDDKISSLCTGLVLEAFDYESASIKSVKYASGTVSTECKWIHNRTSSSFLFSYYWRFVVLIKIRLKDTAKRLRV